MVSKHTSFTVIKLFCNFLPKVPKALCTFQIFRNFGKILREIFVMFTFDRKNLQLFAFYSLKKTSLIRSTNEFLLNGAKF